MKEFMLLLSGQIKQDPNMSIEEKQAAMKKYLEWLSELKTKGIVKAGQPLEGSGRMLNNSGDVLMDGPFIETKEAIGGYFIINAESIDAATEIAKTCPHLLMGGNIEVRPLGEI